MWPAIAAAGAALVGGVLNNQANAQQADKNRDFQSQMSNTSHQREVADLQAAGLNPLLSGTGGASTPSGGMATMHDPLAGAATSALETYRAGLDTKKQSQEITNMKKQGELTDAQKVKTNMESKVLAGSIPAAELKSAIGGKIKNMIETGAGMIREGVKDYEQHKFNKELKLKDH